MKRGQQIHKVMPQVGDKTLHRAWLQYTSITTEVRKLVFIVGSAPTTSHGFNCVASKVLRLERKQASVSTILKFAQNSSLCVAQQKE